MPKIARWYQNKQAAVSLRFDDSRESHVKHAIPILNDYGLRATFMINPGKREYQKYKDFWEIELPKMGHRLGNHTLHHKGAKNLEEADYEIGEVARLIWKLYPHSGGLNVFASGGGEKWGGNFWETAAIEYKMLVEKYDLIDLYDGHHKSKPYNSTDTVDDYCQIIDATLKRGAHQLFHFHNVGKTDFKDLLQKVFKGVSLNVNLETFREILDCLAEKIDILWVAPLIDILKYDYEYKSASMKVLEYHEKQIEMKLKIDIDTDLYNHPLTLIVPITNGRHPDRIYQNNVRIPGYTTAYPNALLFDIKPIDSRITVFYLSTQN